jgi:hypothetical protein
VVEESEMIEKCIENWHRNMRGELPGGLESMIADDCVFYSPIVFSPQKGKELTLLYLNAAGATFSGGGDGQGSAEDSAESGFRYSKEVMSGNHAVLEFETEVQGKYINGIDMITCDGEGKIIEFKVMIRPLQAINLMHQQMAAMLEKLK